MDALDLRRGVPGECETDAVLDLPDPRLIGEASPPPFGRVRGHRLHFSPQRDVFRREILAHGHKQRQNECEG